MRGKFITRHAVAGLPWHSIESGVERTLNRIGA
jgi:hypothetical protein